MTEEPDSGPETDPDFVTVTSDGAFLHFHEGFVSMLFYQDRVIPKDFGAKSINGKRRILFEVRLATQRANSLKNDLEGGLDAYQSLSLLPTDRDMWIEGEKPNLSRELASMKNNRSRNDTVMMSAIRDLKDRLPKKGKKEYDRVVESIGRALVRDHSEEFRKLAQKYDVDLFSKTEVRKDEGK